MRLVTRVIPFMLAPEGSHGVRTGCIVNDQTAALKDKAAVCFVCQQ